MTPLSLPKSLLQGIQYSVLVSALAAVCTGASAQEDIAVPSIGGAGIATLIMNLILVLLIIAVCAWVYSRGQHRLAGSDQGLKVVASHQVGSRERIVVMQVGNEQVMLGITATSINHLHTLTEGLQDSEPDVAPSGFAQRLKQIGQQIGNRSDAT